MTKESAAWLSIRLLGLLLFGYTLLLLVEVVGEAFVLAKLYAIEGSLAAQAERNIVSAWVTEVLLLAQAIASSVFSFYFLTRGSAVHRWLMREAP